MITESTVVFYKDTYDTIYIVDKQDEVNSRDIQYQTIILTPRIPGREDDIRIQNGVVFKYGTVDITREMVSLDGASGTMIAAGIFYSNEPYFNENRHLNKTVKVRNHDGQILHQYDALITEIIDSQTVKLSQDSSGVPVITYKGSGHLSFDNSYHISASGNSVSEDYIRITYGCGWANADGLEDIDYTKGCGSRLQNTFRFKFGPTDNFKVHLDNAITDECDNLVSSGPGFTDLEIGNCIWPYLAEDGSAVDMDTWEPSAGYDVNLIWIDVWGS